MTEKKNSKPRPRKRSFQSVFGTALVVAEKRLAEALDEKNDLAARYNRISDEIPKLENTVAALRRQQSTISVSTPRSYPVPNYTIEQAVSDQPIPIIANPDGSIPLPEMPTVPQPPRPRGGGGAVGLTLEEPEDEDRFLKDSKLPGGEWT